MKRQMIIYLAVPLLVIGCGPKELSRSEAKQLLIESKTYPKVIDYDIYCSDGRVANKVAGGQLEQNGFVVVSKVRTGDKPFFTFTEKASPFLLETSQRDKEVDIQKVKLADEILVEVTGITSAEDGKKAVVEYTTRIENISPFAALLDREIKSAATRKANFTLYDDGWRLEKKD